MAQRWAQYARLKLIRTTQGCPARAMPRGGVVSLPGRKSAFQAGFWPDCYRENTEIGPPAGRRFPARKHYCVPSRRIAAWPAKRAGPRGADQVWSPVRNTSVRLRWCRDEGCKGCATGCWSASCRVTVCNGGATDCRVAILGLKIR
jgi:hypothetical protein